MKLEELLEWVDLQSRPAARQKNGQEYKGGEADLMARKYPMPNRLNGLKYSTVMG